jgi:hypothetical protein
MTDAEHDAFLAGELTLEVTSTHHRAARYWPDLAAMQFFFHDGKSGKLHPVTPQEAELYLRAPSKGKWFWAFAMIPGTRKCRLNWVYD